jgi:hypothetical protein
LETLIPFPFLKHVLIRELLLPKENRGNATFLIATVKDKKGKVVPVLNYAMKAYGVVDV